MYNVKNNISQTYIPEGLFTSNTSRYALINSDFENIPRFNTITHGKLGTHYLVKTERRLTEIENLDNFKDSY